MTPSRSYACRSIRLILISSFLLAVLSQAFASEVISIAAAKGFAVEGDTSHTCTIRGSVTLLPGSITSQPGDFYIQDETSGVLVHAAPGIVVKLWDRVEVTGVMVPGRKNQRDLPVNTRPEELRINASQVVPLGAGPRSEPALVTIADAVAGRHAGQLIQVKGTITKLVIGDTRHLEGETADYFLLGNDPGLWVYTRRSRTHAPWLKDLAVPGSEVEVTGISVPGVDQDFRLRLGSSRDLAIVRASSAVSLRRALWLLAAFGFVGLGTLLWIVSLKRTLRRRTAEIQETEARLRQAHKLEVVSQLAGGIAHDFNNILMAINGYSELLLDSGLNEEQSRHVQKIFKAGQKAAGLTRQLLAFSRGQSSSQTVVDVNRIIDDLHPMLSSVMGAHIRVDIRLGNEYLSVSADRAQLEQVILGMAANSRDAMPNSGIFTIKTEGVTVTRNTAGVAPGRYVVLTISDTGHGMDASTVSRIFEPFFTTKEVGKGSGLGLSTAYGLIRQNNGEIKVQSTPNSGTSFSIYLPYKESTPEVMDLQPSLFDHAETAAANSTNPRSDTAAVAAGKV